MTVSVNRLDGVGKQYWTSVLPEARSGYARSPVFHRDLEAGTPYIYRIFPYHNGVYGEPVEPSVTTEPAVAPDTRLSLRVDAEGPTKLKLTWNEPRTTGGADVTGYYIEVSNDVDDNSTRTGNVWISVNDLDGHYSGSRWAAREMAFRPRGRPMMQTPRSTSTRA